MQLTRRPTLGLLAALAAAPARAQPARAGWDAFRSRFVTPEGRVVDTGNGGVSHSEGQGWALLFALRADDQAGFERILAWTRGTLSRPGDTLLSWRYRPGAAIPVEDPNNASDGDLCAAWALLEAGRRWNRPEHAALGAAMARDVLRLLVRRVGPHTVLLPGAFGFEHPSQVVVNPSYWVFPALPVLARAVPDPAWARLAADGLALLRAARFGKWGLPPDWLAVARADAALSPAEGRPARFSYDAIRVPLWLAWAGLAEEPALRSARAFWQDPAHPFLPEWTDVRTDAIAPYPATGGIRAVAGLVLGGVEPPITPALDYYGAALTLLARLAARDMGA